MGSDEWDGDQEGSRRRMALSEMSDGRFEPQARNRSRR